MGDDSSDDECVLAKPPGNLGSDPGSNEFVRVTEPEEHVDEMEDHRPGDALFPPVISSTPEPEDGEKNDAEAMPPKRLEQGLFTDEAAFHAEPESSGEAGEDHDMLRLPGSFDLIGPPFDQDEGHSTWAEMFRNLHLK
jgi:hypothetical protein